MSDAQLMAQTPQSRGRWGKVEFTLDEITNPDYLICLNRPTSDVVVLCRPSCVWGFVQEPPNEIYRPMHRGQRAFGRVWMADTQKVDSRHILSHPPIPYFVEKSFDELVAQAVPKKSDKVCCIVSANRMFSGHGTRLRFIKELQKYIDVDVYGRGINTIESKWTTLASYKYSIVLENHVHPWWWTEKISDCFLSWTMPLYVGCDRLVEYFPKESFIALDNRSVQHAAEQISNAIASRAWDVNFPHLQEARRRVMFEHGFFPYLAGLIERFESTFAAKEAPARIVVRAITPHVLETWVRARGRAMRLNASLWLEEKVGRQKITRGLSK